LRGPLLIFKSGRASTSRYSSRISALMRSVAGLPQSPNPAKKDAPSHHRLTADSARHAPPDRRALGDTGAGIDRAQLCRHRRHGLGALPGVRQCRRFGKVGQIHPISEQRLVVLRIIWSVCRGANSPHKVPAAALGKEAGPAEPGPAIVDWLLRRWSVRPCPPASVSRVVRAAPPCGSA